MGLNEKRLWAITGSIGSGKSAVQELLRKKNATVIDADHIALQLTEKGHPFLKKLASALGREFLTPDGMALDRIQVRTRITQDPDFKSKLESVLHPEIARVSRELMTKALQETKMPVFYSAALLIESGRHQDFQQILLIEADDSIRINRVIQRDGKPKNEVEKLVSLQMPQSEKRKFATYVIKNNLSKDELEKKVDAFWRDQKF